MHKDIHYPAEHQSVVPPDLFERVQQQLGAGHRCKNAADRGVAPSSLTGKLYDQGGELMSPAHARGRSGRLYRYYVSGSLQRGEPRKHFVQRVPAPAIEAAIDAAVTRLLPDAVSCKLKAVHLRQSWVRLVLTGTTARSLRPSPDDLVEQQGRDCSVTVPLALPLRGGRRSVRHGVHDGTDPDEVLITALRKARALLAKDTNGLPLISTAPSSPYERRLLGIALLAPDIQRAILDGRQPRTLNLERLVHGNIPLGWAEQRKSLGFASAP